MILSPDQLFNTIIGACLDYPEMTIADLHTIINQTQKLSLAQLYKVVADLVDKQLLVKSHKKLSLHPLRVTDMGIIYHRAQQAIGQTTTVINLQPGQNHIRYADTFKSLDNVWNIASHYAMSHSQGAQPYFYNSHTYHIFGMREMELAARQSFSHHGKRPVQFVVGNTTRLDQYGAEIYRQNGCAHVICTQTSFPPQGYFLNIYGDYVIECVLPIALTNYFEVYFQTVTSLADFPVELFEQLFEFKTQLRVKLSYDPVLAETYRSQIQQYLK
jgi:hypothetical protein